MIRPGSAPVREGDLLAGKYRVERVLGAGGMGVVVAARHVELDQLVAIKFVREEALDNEEGVQRFLREARAAVKLKSEHVARVLDVGKLESGAPYMVMEFLEGSDLGKVLAHQGPLPLESAADWIFQACEAVAEAHAAGIVHRDLKPENLFLTRTVGGAPKVKVLDFGVSKAVRGSSGELSGLTRTRAMLGSPLYMAPEQMRSSRDVDSRADIWALGVVLFQLLTDRWPFEADAMPELCLKVVSDPPHSLAALRPDVPEAMVAVVERCLAKDPAGRFANAAELASALEPFVQPSSRLLAERARLSVEIRSSMPSVPESPSNVTPLPVSPMSPLLESGPSGTGMPPTSAAWGSQGTGASPSPGIWRARTKVWAGAAVLVAASVAFVLTLRGPRAGPSPAGSAAPLASASDRPPPVVAAASTNAVTPAPAPASAAASAPMVASAVASSAPMAASALSSGPLRWPIASSSPPPMQRPPGPPPRAEPRPTPQDDDIPALR